MARTLFISDLHLEAENTPITTQFLHFLTEATAADALYILGDLFEAWIGDDDLTPYHRRILAALKAATDRGLPIYVIHGNRDFLLGKRFMQKTGCQLLPDGSKINLYGTSVLLMHGDTLCTRDVKYIKARRKVRNRFLQRLFLWLPLSWRRKLAERMRTISFVHTQGTQPDIMDVTLQEVERVMLAHNVHYLIHGHTHRMGIHQFSLNHSPAMRIVLGAWHQRGSMLSWDDAGCKDLVML